MGIRRKGYAYLGVSLNKSDSAWLNAKEKKNHISRIYNDVHLLTDTEQWYTC